MSATEPRASMISDVQARSPSVALSLSRVGVTGVEKVIRLRHDGAEQLFSARDQCVVELGSDQKGAHVSRFEEVVNEAIGEVVLGDSPVRAEALADHIAQLVRDRQGDAATLLTLVNLATGASPPNHTSRQAWLADTR